jgi:hypothetical protein
MWNEYGGKGLNMYLLESQGTAEDKLKAFLKGKGITAPVQMGGLSGYPGNGGLPFAYVIGVNGKVVFEGRGDYHAAVKTEMAKIKYPGLGMLEVAKGLEKAAGNFVAKAYNKAIDDCNSVIEKGKDEAAIADAKFIIERCNAEGSKLRARIDAAKGEKRYLDAFADLDVLASGFKGMEIGDTAAAEIKELKKDKEVKKEVDAANNLIKLRENVAKMKTKTEKATALRNFAKQKANDGTRAAEEAKADADKVEAEG